MLLLWNIVVDDLLGQQKGTQGYADDITIFVCGKFGETGESDITGTKNLARWCARLPLNLTRRH